MLDQQPTTVAVNWISILPSLIGTLVGGLITLSGFWIKDFLDRRRAVNDWFESTYIQHGIDEIVAFFELAAFHINSQDTLLIKGLDTKTVYPADAMTRLNMLLEYPRVVVVAGVVSIYFSYSEDQMKGLDERKTKELIKCLASLVVALVELRKAILKVKIASKSDIHAIAARPEMQKLTKDFDEPVDALFASLRAINASTSKSS